MQWKCDTVQMNIKTFPKFFAIHTICIYVYAVTQDCSSFLMVQFCCTSGKMTMKLIYLYLYLFNVIIIIIIF